MTQFSNPNSILNISETSKDRIDKIEKALGEPFALEFTEYARKIRSSLFFTSVLSITIITANITLNTKGSSLMGLKFDGINNEQILIVLFILNIYFLTHFIWIGLDNFNEWRLRSSGTRLGFTSIAKISSEEEDHPSDPRQSTLYTWWIKHNKKIENNSIHLQDYQSLYDKLIQTLDKQDDNDEFQNLKLATQSLGNTLHEFSQALASSKNVLENERIEVSLRNFDRSYKRALKGQNLRWILIELLLPSILGLTAITLLLFKMYY